LGNLAQVEKAKYNYYQRSYQTCARQWTREPHLRETWHASLVGRPNCVRYFKPVIQEYVRLFGEGTRLPEKVSPFWG